MSTNEADLIAMAIEFLTSAGYVVYAEDEADPIVDNYYEYGEEWENAPGKVYRNEWQEDRDAFEEALDEVDYAYMVSLWNDKTLDSVAYAGTDLAFNMAQKKAIEEACRDERVSRLVDRGEINLGGLSLGG